MRKPACRMLNIALLITGSFLAFLAPAAAGGTVLQWGYNAGQWGATHIPTISQMPKMAPQIPTTSYQQSYQSPPIQQYHPSAPSYPCGSAFTGCRNQPIAATPSTPPTPAQVQEFNQNAQHLATGPVGQITPPPKNFYATTAPSNARGTYSVTTTNPYYSMTPSVGSIPYFSTNAGR